MLFYNSLHPAYCLAPFILRTRASLEALAVAWIAMTLAGGIGFLVIPFEPAFAPPTPVELGGWQTLFEFADRANLRFNCCPSLHVAWAAATLDIYARRAATPLGRWTLWSWGAGVTLSTLLLHQHHPHLHQ